MQEFTANRIRPRDRLVASVYSLSSALGSLLPEKGERADFTVDHNDPNRVRRRWWVVGSADNYSPAAQWLTYSRDVSASSILPKNFQLSAIMLIDRQIMDQELDKYGSDAIPAVAYKLGTAIMAGYSLKHEILGLEREDDQYYQVAMGIGKGALIAGAGVLLTNGTKFDRNKVYLPLSEGLRQGAVYSKQEIPQFVPRV